MKDLEAGVSSVSPSSFALTNAYSKLQLSKSFTVVFQPLSTLKIYKYKQCFFFTSVLQLAQISATWN